MPVAATTRVNKLTSLLRHGLDGHIGGNSFHHILYAGTGHCKQNQTF
jgi:hypothetical protein